MLKAGDTFQTFCPECNCEVVANLINKKETWSVLGDSLEIVAVVAQCPKCFLIIGDSEVEKYNTQRLYGMYEEKHGVHPSKTRISL